MIRIGYVGVNTALPSASKTFRLANYSEDRMLSVARENLSALGAILEWNLDHRIFLFRITSHLIPFGSSPVNSGSWQTVLGNEFAEIGGFIRNHGMQVSMHPGQYTVLNTPDPSVLEKTLRELEYHAAVFRLMGLSGNYPIIVHGGGAYGDKDASLMVLKRRIEELPPDIRHRIVLENDERVFPAEQILQVCRATGIPGVFDVFHHKILPSLAGLSVRDVILLFTPTRHGRRQKIHYSDQDPNKCPGAHSTSVDARGFGALLASAGDLDLDIMLEVKDKQESVLRLRKIFPELM